MLNLDTHIVVHLVQNSLTDDERRAVRNTPLGISDMVLWEIAKLHQLGRINRGLEDPGLATFLSGCHLWPIDSAVAIASTRLDFRSDPADEIIAATSIVHNVPLLTRDQRILASAMVPFVRL